MSSQCPAVVSFPFERSKRRPATAGAPGCGGLALYVLAILSLSAGVTFLVIRISPTRSSAAKSDNS